MQGPFPIGTHNRLSLITSWEQNRLRRGQWYRVVKPFTDGEGVEHPVGEKWLFLASAFSPHDDELLIAVRFDDGAEWRIVLYWTAAGHQQVIESFSEHVTAAD
jgi:hypothetical protein